MLVFMLQEYLYHFKYEGMFTFLMPSAASPPAVALQMPVSSPSGWMLFEGRQLIQMNGTFSENEVGQLTARANNTLPATRLEFAC